MNIEGFIRSSISFSDFFEKAKKLTNKERGDAFERVVQLHLQSKPKYASELDEVWQLNEVPKDVRKHLKLPEADEGIDLIAKHVDGTYWAVQAKYRGDPDHRLTWGEKGGLSTFTSLAFTTCENIAYGLVVSTTNRPLKKTHLTGNNVGFELYGDLLELDDGGCEGWELMKTGLKGKPKPPKRYKPFSHQRRAIRNAKKHFVKENNARGKMIMPCGTGKSLTGFWIAKELDAKEIVVAVPSLALIKQTLNTWTREYLAHGIKPKWLAVCSDSSAGTVDEDSFTAELYDVGVPCVTDQKAIKKFLKEKSDQPRIIFTTYQSGQVLAKVAKAIKHTFDLGIMDEAHKTVGRKDKVFAHLVDQKNIKIDRRVFMTATERFYQGNSQDIISMDDPDLYGDTFELLTFKQAIEIDKIICDYRFVTIGIAQSEITALWENNDYLRVEGTELDEDTTRSLASGLALRKAYAELGVKRAISFHKSIKLASRFKEQQEQLAEAFPELTEVDCFHVSSKTSTGERNVQLRQFAEADRGLITNARCLTEGVDIPSVDCVLFADPRQSKVDIVQAAGRAMRKADGKEHGFIIVPLVVPDELDLETFADTTAFANVVTIIKALAAEDERIVEYLRVISTGDKHDGGERVETEFTEILAEKVDAAVFLENLKLKVWDKVAKLNWRPFEEARKFVHSLRLESKDEWVDYSLGGLPDKPLLPVDIPRAPNSLYKNEGWISWGDWCGTGRIQTQQRKYRTLTKARAFVHKLHLKSQSEWFSYCNGETPVKEELPDDIPRNPYKVYKDAGWKGYGDWLNTGNIHPENIKWRPFGEAREFVQKLELNNADEWRMYCTNKMPDKETKPTDIPVTADRVYKRHGWQGMGDWLGSGNYSTTFRSFIPFSEARTFVKKLRLANVSEWRAYCKGGLAGKALKPDNIPVAPYRTYAEEWVSFSDWLGTDNVSYRKRELRSFAAARKFVRSLKLESQGEWRKYCKGELPEKGDKPDDIPVNPHYPYKDKGWIGMSDWLGNGNLSPANRQFLQFEEARLFVYGLQIKTQTQWSAYCKGQLEGFDPKPDNIPSTPARYYAEKGWTGFGDWLGTGRTATHLRQYKPFSEARAFAHSLKLKSQIEWREFVKSGKLPLDFPASPIKVYRDKGWSGWRDWLGTSSKKNWRAFEEARNFASALHLKNWDEWIEFSKSGKLPSDIPARPEGAYATEGFSGYKNWLGNEYWSFQQSREYARELRLRSNLEWRGFSKSNLRPKNIPTNPDTYYMEQGWISWSDWLGTDN